MSGKVFSVAILAAVSLAATAYADLRGPAEMPPASYNGQQYVDSRGCVFLRAGHGGRETWVPRVSRDRQQLCGYAPSGRPVATAEAAPATVAPPVVKPAAVKPEGTGFSKAKSGAPLPLPAPMQSAFDAAGAAPGASVSRKPAVVAAAPVVKSSTVSGGTSGYRIACPANAPVAQKFRLQDGETRTLCTRGDGSLTGATFPRLVDGTLKGREIGPDSWSGVATSTTTGQTITVQPRYTGGDRVPTPPPGYKLAWDDDRLNPDRGKQTTKGIADQEKIWSRTTPAVPYTGNGGRKLTIKLRDIDGTIVERPGIVVATAADGTRTVRLLPDGSVSKSSKSTPDLISIAPSGKASVAKGSPAAAAPTATPTAKPAAGGRVFIQVGTFGVASNADGTAGRLQGLGLPVSRSSLRGGALQVVYAGPFASSAEAGAALSRVRGAGFGDAVIVQ